MKLAGIVHLLRPSFQEAARGADTASRLQSMVAGTIVWVAIFWLSCRGLGAFSQYPEIADALRGRILTTSIEAITLLIIMAATQFALDQCFLASDVPMIVRAPVDWLTRCLAQMTRVSLWTLAPVILVLTPLLAALSVTSAHPLTTGTIAILGLIPLLALTASIGVLLAIALASVSGAERGKGVLVVFGAMLLGAVLFIMRESSTAHMLTAMHGSDPMAMADMLNSTPSHGIPVAWWATALIQAGSGAFDWAALLGFWGAALGSVTVASAVYGTLYDRVRSLSSRTSKSGSSRLAATIRGWFDERLGAQPTTILANDLLRVWRNRADWSHTLLLGFAGAIYLANIATLPLGGDEPLTRLFAQVLSLMNIGVSGLILASLAAHYVLPSVAFEWPGRLLLAGAPISSRTIAYGKYAVSLLVCLPLGVALAWLTAHIVGVGGGILWITLGATLSIGSGVVALALWLGSREPRLVRDGAAQTIASIETTLYVALSFVLSLAVVLAIAPFTLTQMGTLTRAPAELTHLLATLRPWSGPMFVLGLLGPLGIAVWALRGARSALALALVGQPEENMGRVSRVPGPAS